MSEADRRESGPHRGYAPDFLTELFRAPLDPGYTDAAARRSVTGPPQGWRRVTARAAMALSMAAVGFLVVLAYQKTVADEPSRSQARAGLVEQVTQRQAETDELQNRVDALRDEVARERDTVLDGARAADLRDLEAAAGLARVTGDGVVVELADAPEMVDPVTGEGSVSELGRVLDRDLQDVANALWSVGAEAVAVNGRRLTATSTIRAAGSAILVDFRPVTGPYEVSAIGPESMADAFRTSQAAAVLRAVSADHGLSFGVRSADDLMLPAASGPQLRYARAPSASASPSGTGGADPSVTASGGSPR
ncbi:DUF881 domain-containing protein [Micromonospora sp. LOL_013]|uniref:DUF881 domain-containing protein n=1 Tax=Micromonospora sp. LOL_013 TaxID=3345414 RepID=UPI003A8B5CCB